MPVMPFIQRHSNEAFHRPLLLLSSRKLIPKLSSPSIRWSASATMTGVSQTAAAQGDFWNDHVQCNF